MANLNDFDIFNLKVEDVVTESKGSKANANLYSPKYDEAPDGVYKSKVRFLPNFKNPRKSIMRKYVYYLMEDRVAKKGGFYVDSPSTVGEKCPCQDAFFKLRNSESAIDKKLSEELKRKENFYSYVQIIEDKQHPELEGKIMVMKYGFQIKQKIDEQLNPQIDDEEPTQIFDLFEGKDFYFIAKKVDGYANFLSSKFANKITAIKINGKEVDNDDDGRQEILSWLNENAPDMNEFEYKPWDNETRTKVAKVLAQYISPGENIENITKGDNDSKSNDSKSNDDSEEDDDWTPKKRGENVKKEEKSKKEEKEPEVESDDDDFDEFLKGIDDDN